jgi:hypothetical protein
MVGENRSLWRGLVSTGDDRELYFEHAVDFLVSALFLVLVGWGITMYLIRTYSGQGGFLVALLVQIAIAAKIVLKLFAEIQSLVESVHGRTADPVADVADS